MRGEYRALKAFAREKGELPPRARRIPRPHTGPKAYTGTTSACAENTTTAKHGAPSNGNYLRVRGEYPVTGKKNIKMLELPPRARRIRRGRTRLGRINGTTSACAENTSVSIMMRHVPRNYLRVRGEYMKYWHEMAKDKELPPRARRIPEASAIRRCAAGTTSACAENTFSGPLPDRTARNYLRVRGEYIIWSGILR